MSPKRTGDTVLVRSILVVLLLVTFGCSSATYIRAKVTNNPLDRVAQQAQEDWSVDRLDANTLQLSDAWPIHSFFTLGYTASHANLSFDRSGSVLYIQYYLQSNQLGLLFIPIYLDAEPGFVGGALKPIMRGQIDDILRWSEASVISRRAGEQSEPFPPMGLSSQSTGIGQTISPDVIASGPLTGAMLGNYDTVAILPFADAPHAPNSGSTVADIVSTQLLDLDFTVVERTRLQQLFEEQGLQLRSADEQANAIRIGRLTGAKAVVVGAVQQWETQKGKGADKSFVALSLRLVDVETGAILFVGQGQFREPISEVLQMTAGIITGTIFDRMAIQTGLRRAGRIGFHHELVDRVVGKTPMVRSVMPGLPAEKAGLKVGDVILSCNGSTSVTWKRKRDILRACSVEPGQDLVLEVARGEQRLTIRATAVSRY